MKPVAVIGAGYGDEGKGALVDALATPDHTVIRFNGGAQAGHTVVRDGRRVVFHHVGAGSLAGAKTYLSRFFVVNPILFRREIEDLGFLPEISVSPDSPVTTPVEMMINQAVEMNRTHRHGSCGLGFGETWERQEKGVSLTVRDFCDPFVVSRVVEEWLPVRCAALGLDVKDICVNPNVLKRFKEDFDLFIQSVRVRDAGAVKGDVVFEGAQGLGLDEDLGAFPHVTRSHTGLPNISALCLEMGIPDIRVFYATRAYATRHGAGPLSREGEWEGDVPEDPTNLENPWQGALRFAPLDEEQLAIWINGDRARCNGVNVEAFLGVSCLDQVSGEPLSCARGLADRINMPLGMIGIGPSADDRIFL